MNTDKINGVGTLFRFITPALIIIVGTLILTIVKNIDKDVCELKSHFTNHLSEHQELSVLLEHRLTRLEMQIERKR